MERRMDYTITIRMVEETPMAKGGRMETGFQIISMAIMVSLMVEVMRPWKSR